MSGGRCAAPRFVILERDAGSTTASIKLDVLRLRHERFDGGWTARCGASCSCSAPAVVVLPYDPDAGSGRAGRAVPHRLHRPARRALADRGGGGPGRAGRERPRRSPFARCARRPASRSGGSSSSCRYHASPGGTTEQVHVYVAEVAAPERGRRIRRRARGRGHPHPSSLPAERAFAMVRGRPDHRRQRRDPAALAAAPSRAAAARVAACHGLEPLRRRPAGA